MFLQYGLVPSLETNLQIYKPETRGFKYEFLFCESFLVSRLISHVFYLLVGQLVGVESYLIPEVRGSLIQSVSSLQISLISTFKHRFIGTCTFVGCLAKVIAPVQKMVRHTAFSTVRYFHPPGGWEFVGGKKQRHPGRPSRRRPRSFALTLQRNLGEQRVPSRAGNEDQWKPE